MLIKYAANGIPIAALTITKGVPSASFSGTADAMAVRAPNVGSTVQLTASVIYSADDPEVISGAKKAGLEEAVPGVDWRVDPKGMAIIGGDGKATFQKTGKALVGLNWAFMGPDKQIKNWLLAAEYTVTAKPSMMHLWVPMAIGAASAVVGTLAVRKSAKG